MSLSPQSEAFHRPHVNSALARLRAERCLDRRSEYHGSRAWPPQPYCSAGCLWRYRDRRRGRVDRTRVSLPPWAPSRPSCPKSSNGLLIVSYWLVCSQSAALAIIGGVIRLTLHQSSDPSYAGVALAAISLVALIALSARKQQVARRVSSNALPLRWASVGDWCDASGSDPGGNGNRV